MSGTFLKAEPCSAFLFDTHCHLMDVPLSWQRKSVIGGLAVVAHPDAFFISDNRRESPSLWQYAIGLHPWVVDKPVDWVKFEKAVQSDPQLAIGEIGLDGYKSHWQLQKQLFTYQLQMAARYHRLVSVHLVKDHGEGFHLLKSSRVSRVVIHGFCGSLALAKQYQGQGWLLGLGSRCLSHLGAKQTAMLLGLDRNLFVLESDAPYTCRADNTPDVLCEIVVQLAALWQVDVCDVIQQANRNWQKIGKEV